MSHLPIIFTTGLAMFAMFFGSGNLVFPLQLGVTSEGQYVLAIIGLLITGVIVPFLGLFSVMLYDGNREKYFGLLGKWAPFVLSLLILSLLGPFGVVPRCIIVAYGGINVLFPELPLAWFSGIFSLMMLVILWQKNQIIAIIGKFLGPLKISVILLIIIVAFFEAKTITTTGRTIKPFINGLNEGYQTMDLLAAFFFSVTIVEHLKRSLENKEDLLRVSLWSGLVGGALIAIIYICFVLLGAYYAMNLANIAPEQYLTTIAMLTLGKNAALIVAIALVLSCLTTAATLSRLFAEFVHIDIFSNKISWGTALFITLAISFLFSLTGFKVISGLLGNILGYIYPALIVLAVTSILQKIFNINIVKKAFWATMLISITMKMLL